MSRGVLFCLLYAFSVAFTSVTISKIGHDLPIALYLFYASLLAVLIYNIFDCKNYKRNHAVITSSPMLWSVMSLCIVLIWTATYITYVYVTPHFLLAVLFLTSASIGCYVSGDNRKLLFCLGGIAACVAFEPNAGLVGTLLAMSTGVFNYVYMHCSKNIAKIESVSSLGILSTRFYLLLLLSGSYLLWDKGAEVFVLDLQTLLLVVFICLFNVIIPLYFSQSAIVSLGAVDASKVMTITPALTFAVGTAVDRQVNYGMLTVCFGVVAILCMDRRTADRTVQRT